MAKIKNVGYKEFCEKVKSKKIVLWGGGRLAEFYIQTYCRGLDIISIVDKNEDLNGKKITVNETEYSIAGVHEFLLYLNANPSIKEDISIFITPTYYAGEIMKELDEISVLEEVDCYVGVLMRHFYESSQFSFSEGKEVIPKKIHYCWFGKKDIPDSLKKYMESWNLYCPDYEIIRWDESNYDISKNKYMLEAYKSRKWGFVPDYARLDIVYNEGGIYLDTDVELVASLDKLLKDEMFCGLQHDFIANFGAGFGARKHHPIIKELRDYYEDKSFYLDNGQLNLKACYEYQNPILEKFGFKLEMGYQKKDGVVLYPAEVLLNDMGLGYTNRSGNTIAIHHNQGSWLSTKEKNAFDAFKRDLVEKKLI